VPFVSKARDYHGWGPGVRWTLRIVLLLVIFLLSWAVQAELVERGVIKSPAELLRGFPLLQKFWLPLFVLLVILFFWVGYWVWTLWTLDEEDSEFEDIDRAWEEAVKALDRAGIGIGDAPLFLVLGQPALTEETLFRASKREWIVRRVPEGGDRPLHVYANRDAIFVTCAGASLVGHQAKTLASAKTTSAGPIDAPADDQRVYQTAVDLGATLTPDARAGLIAGVFAQANREGRELTKQEQVLLRWLGHVGGAQPAAGAVAGQQPAPLFRNTAEIDHWSNRLKHLCRLIVRDRRPYCPMNGLLLLISLAATEERHASDAALVCQRDVATLRETLQLHFPTIALVCDVEKAPGFSEFVRGFPRPALDQRLGSRFPWLLDRPQNDWPRILEECIGWICHSLPSFWTYGSFQVESDGQERGPVVAANARLFQFMADMSLRHQNLSRILVNAITPDRTPLPLFGGCYLAGTGREEQEQVWVKGVFDKLIQVRGRDTPMQNLVYWSQAGTNQDAQYNRWANYGWIGIVALALVVLSSLSYYAVQTFRSQATSGEKKAAHWSGVVQG
jgi:hypothetical protein